MGCSSSKHILATERRAQLDSFDDLIVLSSAKTDVDRVMDVVTVAFSGSAAKEGASDMHWALGPGYADFDSAERLDIVHFSMRLTLLKCLKDGAVLVGRRDDATTTGNLKAMAAFTRRSKFTAAGVCDLVDYIKIAAALVKSYPMRTSVIKENRGLPKDVQAALEQIGTVEAAFHKKHTSGPHYHVQFVAVDPAAQGQGHSSKLMRRINELADAEGLPCFLFTAGPAGGAHSQKVAIYSKFGYATVEERTITDKAGSSSITCYAMVRPPSRT